MSCTCDFLHSSPWNLVIYMYTFGSSNNTLTFYAQVMQEQVEDEKEQSSEILIMFATSATVSSNSKNIHSKLTSNTCITLFSLTSYQGLGGHASPALHVNSIVKARARG